MAKKNYANLVKKVITDSKGHRKSVWVKRGDGKDQSSAKKTNIDEVDKVISEHGSHSKTPSISLIQLKKTRDKLSKKLDRLAGGTSSNAAVREKIKNHGNALGEIKRHILSLEKKSKDSK